MWIHGDTCGYMWIHGDTCGYMGIHGDTCGYMGIHVDTWGYMGIYGDIWVYIYVDICGYMGIHGDTCGYMWIHGDTCGYMQWRREGRGGAGGAIALGPGPVVGARAKLDFFCALIGSQWGIQGGGTPELVPILKTLCKVFFGGRMTSRGQCPRGGGGACECLHPPLQEILYPPWVGGGHELCCPGARPGSRRHSIHGDTWGYMWIHGDTWGYIWIHGDTWGYMGIHGDIWVYVYYVYI